MLKQLQLCATVSVVLIPAVQSWPHVRSLSKTVPAPAAPGLRAICSTNCRATPGAGPSCVAAPGADIASSWHGPAAPPEKGLWGTPPGRGLALPGRGPSHSARKGPQPPRQNRVWWASQQGA